VLLLDNKNRLLRGHVVIVVVQQPRRKLDIGQQLIASRFSPS
jgi:hypothetical protein